MLYDETNSIAYHIMSNIGEWIKGEDETHVFQIDLADVQKTFSVTIDCEQNNIVCVQQHGKFNIYDENDISENLLDWNNCHFDQDEKNEEIYWINCQSYMARIELEEEFISIAISKTDPKDEKYNERLYYTEINWKE